MYNVTYISDADRKRLVVLNEGLRMCETVEEQQELRKEIALIEERRKPLSECDMIECAELRTAIWDKFDRLNRTGKYNIAHNFKLMLKQIESHQGTLHRKLALEEAQRLVTERENKAKLIADAAAKRKTNKEEEKESAKSITSRWTTGIGSLD